MSRVELNTKLRKIVYYSEGKEYLLKTTNFKNDIKFTEVFSERTAPNKLIRISSKQDAFKIYTNNQQGDYFFYYNEKLKIGFSLGSYYGSENVLIDFAKEKAFNYADELLNAYYYDEDFYEKNEIDFVEAKTNFLKELEAADNEIKKVLIDNVGDDKCESYSFDTDTIPSSSIKKIKEVKAKTAIKSKNMPKAYKLMISSVDIILENYRYRSGNN